MCGWIVFHHNATDAFRIQEANSAYRKQGKSPSITSISN